jgi:hypothetical protein
MAEMLTPVRIFYFLTCGFLSFVLLGGLHEK